MPTKKISKRQQVVDIVDRNIKEKNMNFNKLYKTFTKSSEYRQYKEAGEYDFILEDIVDDLGLSFELYFKDIVDWSTDLGKEENEKLPLPIWEGIVKNYIETQG